MVAVTITQITPHELETLIETSLSKIIAKQFSKPQTTNNEVTYLTRREVADKYKVSLATIHKWINAGKLLAYKAGRSTRFKSNEVELLLTSKK